MNTPCKRSVSALASCVALAGLALSTQADAGVRIEFRDLDLGSAEGVSALYARIDRAAKLVCSDSSAPWDAGRSRSLERCHAMAVEDAVAAINQPRLTALHIAKSGRPVQVGAAPK